MDKIIRFIQKNGDYARLSELREQGFQTRNITRLHEEGVLEKLQPGLYKLKESNITSGLVDISKAMPRAVIALVSALVYHELSAFNPSKIHVAIPNDAKPPILHFPPVEVYYFRKNQYQAGIEEKKIYGHTVKIYNKEKAVCDMFRFRYQIGEDLAFEGLKNYLKHPEANLNKLKKYMNICRVTTIMKPFLKMLLA